MIRTGCKYISLVLLITTAVYGRDIYVNPGQLIQDAINTSTDGDKIIVNPGIYNQNNINIYKSIILEGINFPVIDAEQKGQIITISADNVTLKGFTIKNSGVSSLDDFSAVKINNTKYSSIENNKFEYNFFAVYLAGASNCRITSNTIISDAYSESSSGNGIHLWKCDSIYIEYNYISGHRDGIYFEFATNSYIKGNYSTKNIRYGLHFMFSNNDTYESNVFIDNGAGVAVMYTKNVVMRSNRFENNWGPNSYGLLLKDITYSIIENNVFYKNTVGIYTEGGVSLFVEKNTFEENGWAAKILGNCYDNSIRMNNFINNSFDVASNSSQSTNKFENNFWDKYNGYDLNRDGIGDVPYRPTSLFAMIAEDSPGTMILLRSLIVDIMDMAEKVMPVFVPETLSDNSPLMYKAQ